MGGRQELTGVERTGALGHGGLLRKLDEGEGESAELIEVRVGRSRASDGEDWRRWSKLDGHSLPSEERRG
jgi:hypothetical protein